MLGTGLGAEDRKKKVKFLMQETDNMHVNKYIVSWW